MASNKVLSITLQIFSADFEFFKSERCCVSLKVIVRDTLTIVLLEAVLVDN